MKRAHTAVRQRSIAVKGGRPRRAESVRMVVEIRLTPFTSKEKRAFCSSHSQEIRPLFLQVVRGENFPEYREMEAIEELALREQLLDALLKAHGQVVGGSELANLLGFKSSDSMRKAVSHGILYLQTFPIPGRHGRHALTIEVVDWLIRRRSASGPGAPCSQNALPQKGGP